MKSAPVPERGCAMPVRNRRKTDLLLKTVPFRMNRQQWRWMELRIESGFFHSPDDYLGSLIDEDRRISFNSCGKEFRTCPEKQG